MKKKATKNTESNSLNFGYLYNVIKACNCNFSDEDYIFFRIPKTVLYSKY